MDPFNPAEGGAKPHQIVVVLDVQGAGRPDRCERSACNRTDTQ